MSSVLTFRVRPFTVVSVSVVIVMLAGVTVFCVVLALALLVSLSPMALFFGVVAALFGYATWHIMGHVTVYRRCRVDIVGNRIVVTRVLPEVLQWPRFENVSADVDDVVRVGFGERLVPTRYQYERHACVWVDLRDGRRVVLAGGCGASASFLPRLAEAVGRRVGAAPVSDPGFRIVGPFGAAVAGEAGASPEPAIAAAGVTA